MPSLKTFRPTKLLLEAATYTENGSHCKVLVGKLNERLLGRPGHGCYNISKWILHKQDGFINLAHDGDK